MQDPLNNAKKHIQAGGIVATMLTVSNPRGLKVCAGVIGAISDHDFDQGKFTLELDQEAAEILGSALTLGVDVSRRCKPLILASWEAINFHMKQGGEGFDESD